jgi:hypothetical protein
MQLTQFFRTKKATPNIRAVNLLSSNFPICILIFTYAWVLEIILFLIQNQPMFSAQILNRVGFIRFVKILVFNSFNADRKVLDQIFSVYQFLVFDELLFENVLRIFEFSLYFRHPQRFTNNTTFSVEYFNNPVNRLLLRLPKKIRLSKILRVVVQLPDITRSFITIMSSEPSSCNEF